MSTGTPEGNETDPSSFEDYSEARMFIVRKAQELLTSAVNFDNQMAGNTTFASAYVRHGVRFDLGNDDLICHRLNLIPRRGTPLRSILSVELLIPENELYSNQDGVPSFVIVTLTSSTEAAEIFLIGEFGMTIIEIGEALPIGINPLTLKTELIENDNNPDLSNSAMTPEISELLEGYRLLPQVQQTSE